MIRETFNKPIAIGDFVGLISRKAYRLNEEINIYVAASFLEPGTNKRYDPSKHASSISLTINDHNNHPIINADLFCYTYAEYTNMPLQLSQLTYRNSELLFLTIDDVMRHPRYSDNVKHNLFELSNKIKAGEKLKKYVH